MHTVHGYSVHKILTCVNVARARQVDSCQDMVSVNAPAGRDDGTGGALSAFRVHPATGALELLNTMSTGGAHPCYVSVAADLSLRGTSGDECGIEFDDTCMVLCANYSSGSVAAFRTYPDGR